MTFLVENIVTIKGNRPLLESFIIENLCPYGDSHKSIGIDNLSYTFLSFYDHIPCPSIGIGMADESHETVNRTAKLANLSIAQSEKLFRDVFCGDYQMTNDFLISLGYGCFSTLTCRNVYESLQSISSELKDVAGKYFNLWLYSQYQKIQETLQQDSILVRDWCIRNWGTPENAMNFTCAYDENFESLVLKFQTESSFPLPVFEKLFQKNPRVEMDVKFISHGAEYCGHMKKEINQDFIGKVFFMSDDRQTVLNYGQSYFGWKSN